MKQLTTGYVANRVLRLNVGFVIAAGPGYTHKTTFDVPAIRVAEDAAADYLRGTLRLTRTKEGVLVQGLLQVGTEVECYRCLDPIKRELDIEVEELYAYPAPIDGEFSITDDGVLDLAPLVRAEMLIQDAERTLCSPDCKGLCAQCGTNLNHETCMCEEEMIDPRFAALRQLLE